MPLPPLELEQILGVNHETHSSVHFVSPNHIVYPVEAMVVVMDTTSRRQAFFRGHSHVVSTVAVHAGKRLCVSGQRRKPASKQAEVLVWHWNTRAVHRSLVHHQGDVLAVSFSVCGTRVLSVGTDNNKASVVVWSLGPAQAKKVCTATLHGEVVHAALPGPTELQDAFEWITYGVGQVKFWSLSKYQPTLTVRKGTFGPGCPSGAVPTVTAATFLQNQLIVGTSDGRIYYFEGARGGKCVRTAKCAVAYLTSWRNRLVATLASGKVLLLADHHTK
jgi:WD40 repeat protein